MQNKKIKNYYLFGQHAVTETLKNQPMRAKILWALKGIKNQEPITLAKNFGIRINFTTKDTLDKLLSNTSQNTHQGLVLEAKAFEYSTLEKALENSKNKFCLILDCLTDSRNFGRCIRSAYALGADFIILPKDKSVLVNATVEKAAVGTASKIPIIAVTNLSQSLKKLKESGYWVLGTSDKDQNSKSNQSSKKLWEYDFSSPTAIVIGNEEKGMRELTKKSCDALVHIPMSEEGLSLNAADGAAIVMYEAAKSRQ